MMLGDKLEDSDGSVSMSWVRSMVGKLEQGNVMSPCIRCGLDVRAFEALHGVDCGLPEWSHS